MTDVKRFEEFLGGVDLPGYREMYQRVKLVEMDLPKNIQALALLYEVYWDQKRFVSYEEFYKIYVDKYANDIEAFREKITMCADCFHRGLPARIYRTWASIITQIHAGYVAEAVFGDGSVAMSAELDHQGADIQVKYKELILNYQVKKQSFSREVRAAKPKSKNKLEGEFLDIWYDVPNSKIFLNPKRLNGEFRAPYLRFINNKQLKRLDNGFVVFTEHTFVTDKQRLDKLAKLVSAG